MTCIPTPGAFLRASARPFLSALSSLLLLALPLVSSVSHAWGRHGHAIVDSTAGYLVADSDGHGFMREHSFDLGYFANVPDLLWKRPETYKIESPQHFMDMEIYDRALKAANAEASVWELDRLSFEKKFPQIEVKAGRSWWRIQELLSDLSGLDSQLKAKELTAEKRHELQAQWLALAGVIGHYVGDLSQPLHVTENYDGQMSDQKGVHAFFEDTLVDQLDPDLSAQVFRQAQGQWADFHSHHQKASVQDLLHELIESSRSKLPEVLAMDKKLGRKDPKKIAASYQPLILERLTIGSLVLAELYSRHMDWKFDDEKFYNFIALPPYVYPPGEKASAKGPEKNSEKNLDKNATKK